MSQIWSQMWGCNGSCWVENGGYYWISDPQVQLGPSKFHKATIFLGPPDISDRIKDINKNTLKIKIWDSGESPRETYFDKTHTKRNSMLLAVKEWLSYCPPWDQKEEVISFIMYLGRKGKKGGGKTLLNKLQCQNILQVASLQFSSPCRIHTCFDNTSANLPFTKLQRDPRKNISVKGHKTFTCTFARNFRKSWACMSLSVTDAQK